MRAFATPLFVLALAALSGCIQEGVKEIQIHIGWNEDGQSQYMTPSSMKAKQGDKVRFVVTNDDDPSKDYNGDKPGKDNFHDVALLEYDGDGDGLKDDIEHEVQAGKTVTTAYKGKDYFTATTKGTFEVICEVRTVPSHRELGMKAAFIVE